MTTISTTSNIDHNGIHHSRTTTKLPRNHKHPSNHHPTPRDINRNAATSQAEYERNACEEELYKLRYGIERLLADNVRDGFKTQSRSSFREVLSKVSNFAGVSWFDRCSPCCRRRRRNILSPNRYTPHRVHTDENYTPLSQPTATPSPLQSDSVASTPSTSSVYNDPNLSHTKNDLRKSIDSLINPTTPSPANVSELLTSFDVNDPAYNSLVLKIIEAKTLDCLCTGYSSRDTQKQMTKALSELNQRFNERPSSSVSATSSQSSVPSESISPSPSITPTPTTNESTSPAMSPQTKSSLKVDGNDGSSRKKSNVKIVEGKSSKRSKSKTKRRSSGRNRKGAKTLSKPRRTSTRTSKRRSRSKTSKKGRTKSKASAKGRSASKTPTTKRSRSNASNRKRTSSKLKQQKGSAKSRSSTKSAGRSKRNAKRKRRKAKSNNQVDDRQIFAPSAYLHPQSYQEAYRNRQRLFQSLLSTA